MPRRSKLKEVQPWPRTKANWSRSSNKSWSSTRAKAKLAWKAKALGTIGNVLGGLLGEGEGEGEGELHELHELHEFEGEGEPEGTFEGEGEFFKKAWGARSQTCSGLFG